MHRVAEAEFHLRRAREVFEYFDDRIRCAQVDDSLARLYLDDGRLHDAETAIESSIKTMEAGDEDALLAESLMTKGIIYCKLRRYKEAQKLLEASYRLSSRCGDTEGAGRAVLIIAEEIADVIEMEERPFLRAQLKDLLLKSQQASVKDRAKECLRRMAISK
jgi:tetratricopeptide (TPR) repeat protein